MITVQLHNLIFACKYNRRALRKVTSSFEEVLYIKNIGKIIKMIHFWFGVPSYLRNLDLSIKEAFVLINPKTY